MCVAQTSAPPAETPPPEVDQAVRARISEFYQDHVDGKFRQAEALVAEDTKDYFYSASKPRYLSYEIEKVEFSQGFTSAKATVRCGMYINIVGFQGAPMKVPIPSTWKLVDGQWYWYVDQKVHESPFGLMNPGPPKPPSGAAGTPGVAALIPTPEQMQALADQLKTLVKADKTVVNLRPDASDQITLTNTSAGLMNVSIHGAIPGVDVHIDHLDLKPHGNAVLGLKAQDGAKSGTISIQVDQTNQVIPIQVKIE